MSKSKTLWPLQLTALHTLWGKYSARFPDPPGSDPRVRRLAWAAEQIGRTIGSFNKLSVGEAGQLIDALKRALGQEVKPAWRRPRGRQAAHDAGMHGRENFVVTVPVLAGPEDFEKINQLCAAIGMTAEQLDLFVRGPKSPTRGGAIRTLADANRVIWALKGMARRRAG